MYLLLDIDWSFFDHELWGEKVSNYMWFAGIILLTLLLKNPVTMLLTRLGSVLTSRYNYSEHKGRSQALLFKPIGRLLQVILYYIAISQLDSLLDKVVFRHAIGKTEKVHVKLGDVVDHVFLFLFIVCLTLMVSRFIDFIFYLRVHSAQKERNIARLQLLPLLKEITKLAMWAVSFFCILGSVFEVNVLTLITSLGIGGVAIALAGKETVENFIAAFTILSDKPFQTGDTIKLGDIEAVVERIGFRSTRLRNTDGSAYVIPNQNLVSQNLVNVSMSSTRGLKTTVNIRYGISHEKLTQLIEQLKQAVLNIPPVKEPVLISVTNFDKETFQLNISYDLPLPLPQESKLAEIKRDINLKVFEIASANATLGATGSG